MVASGFAHAVSSGAEVSSFDVGYALQTELFRIGTSVTSGLVDLFHTTDTGVLTSVFARDSWRPTARLGATPGLRIRPASALVTIQ